LSNEEAAYPQLSDTSGSFSLVTPVLTKVSKPVDLELGSASDFRICLVDPVMLFVFVGLVGLVSGLVALYICSRRGRKNKEEDQLLDQDLEVV